MNETWRKNEVWIFLPLIVLVNSLFIGGISSGLVPNHFYNLGRFALLGLTLASVVFAIRRFTGLRELVSSLSAWRVNPLWYLLALLWAPTMSVLFLAAKSLLTGENAFEDMTYSLVQRPSMLRTVLIASLIGEIVWVAYSINTLSKQVGMLAGSLVVGGFWALWWFPMALLDKGVLPGLSMVPLAVSMVGIATMCGFVYLNSRSGPVVLLLQIMVNISFLIFPLAPTNGGAITFLAYSATYLAAALALFFVFGPRPLFGRSPMTSPDQAMETAA